MQPQAFQSAAAHPVSVFRSSSAHVISFGAILIDGSEWMAG